MMRMVSGAAAALLLLALVTAWGRQPVPGEAAVGAPPADISRSAEPARPPEPPLAATPPAPDPGVDERPPAPVERDAPPAPVAQLPEVTVLVERADFEEAPLTHAGAGRSPPPAPAPAAGPERSGDLVRRLLGLQEALRE